jgi:hypothetical protein
MARRGRPLGDKPPMTDAERQRKRRERLKQQQPETPLSRAKKEIERLKRRITQLETELLIARARRHGAAMDQAAHRTIIKALHPDYRPSDAEREAACKAFNVWIGRK